MEPKLISDHHEVLAIIFPKGLTAEGVRFLTPEDYLLQVGLLEHKNGRQVPPHRHRDLVDIPNTHKSQEFIYVVGGQGILVKIFNDAWEEIDQATLAAGDSILFVSGGHSLDIPPGCRLLEIKSGPYPGDRAAKIFKN